MAVALESGCLSRGIWRQLQHQFQLCDLDPRAVPAIRADLLLRASSTYLSPESSPESPDEVWHSTFRKLTRREHNCTVVTAGHNVLKQTAAQQTWRRK